MADVLPNLAADVGAVDLGPTPAPGGTRLLTKDEMRRALEDAKTKVPATLPPAVRVTRKMQRMTPADIERITRRAFDESPLPRGAALSAVRATGSAEIPAGWDTVRVTLPQRPHRVGIARATAVLTFGSGPDTVGTLTVPVELSLGPEAAAWDLAKGASVRVVVRRGAIEIEAPAIATADADIGSVLAVMLRSSGRIVRVRLLDRDQAELVEGG
jgi:hypothetical protein